MSFCHLTTACSTVCVAWTDQNRDRKRLHPNCREKSIVLVRQLFRAVQRRLFLLNQKLQINFNGKLPFCLSMSSSTKEGFESPLIELSSLSCSLSDSTAQYCQYGLPIKSESSFAFALFPSSSLSPRNSGLTCSLNVGKRDDSVSRSFWRKVDYWS